MLLAEKLKEYRKKDAVVLAVPRGGVPVGYEIARGLKLPLDIALSKKIGHPHNKEFAVGSVSEDSLVLDETGGVSEEYLQSEITRIRKELHKQYKLFMGDIIPESIKDRIVILVDDGIATGNTLLVTIEMLRKDNPSQIVVATPVIPQSNVDRIDIAADKLVYLTAPYHFPGVGAFYEDFTQVTDEEVIQLLKEANRTYQKH